jgi:hypothetical protein
MLLRERAEAWLQEQVAQVKDKINGVNKDKWRLELALIANEAAQNTRNSASEFGDVAGALGHARAWVSIFTHVTTLAHTPAMHNNPHLVAFGKGGNCIVNPPPRCEHHQHSL